MRKFTLMAILAFSFVVNAIAEDFKTAGDGKSWTMTALSETAGTGVTKNGTAFTMANTVVIAAGDHFQIESGITVCMGEDVSLEVEGTAGFEAAERVLFTRTAEGVSPNAVYIKGETEKAKFKNIDFEYAGLKCSAPKGLEADRCTFKYHQASKKHGSSAVNMGLSGAEFLITNCMFSENVRSAIGGAANSSNSITIENCIFLKNGTSNLNYPQINLTCAPQVIIRNCYVEGAPQYTRVGAIVVSDLVNVARNPHTLIENCVIKNARFGIALYSNQKAVVKDNLLLNNNAETNPNNGGSGINITDASGQQETMITGNYIEGSLWGVTIIGGKTINLGKTGDPTAADYNPGQNTFYNNGNNGVVYDLYNNSANTVYAQGNYWKTAGAQTVAGIENVIYHKADNATLGEVIFTPFSTADASGVQPAVSATSQESEIYTLGGIKAGQLRKGLNIVRKGGKVMKVMK